ncbi:hypothetical protein J4Q44_G00071190 [Coregonus suidteri]|uniref:Uncharacterized protein n=1 Tax=Coregonus suidteri TaxID=861788 RepID=A0AAN8RCQ5_9TELE
MPNYGRIHEGDWTAPASYSPQQHVDDSHGVLFFRVEIQSLRQENKSLKEDKAEIQRLQQENRALREEVKVRVVSDQWANGSVGDLSLPDELNLLMGYQQGLELLETRLSQDTELQERLSVSLGTGLHIDVTQQRIQGLHGPSRLYSRKTTNLIGNITKQVTD